MITHLPHTMRELDSRTSDGLHIRLLWDSTDGRVSVAVADSKNGDDFDFEVRERERAREAFEHPFSYMAWLGLTTASSDVELSEVAA